MARKSSKKTNAEVTVQTIAEVLVEPTKVVEQPVADYWYWYQNKCKMHNIFRCPRCKPGA